MLSESIIRHRPWIPDRPGYRRAAATPYTDVMPGLIVRPRTPADVATALHSAVHLGLRVSVRSGGHSLLGSGTHTEAMVIDVGLLDRVEVPDPETRVVRVGGGARWGTVARALDRYGLGLTAGDTGSVGGRTLGGGVGWLDRRYGLAIDSLVGVDVVTAEGRLLHASADEHADLFWALRGGGGGFGVVVEFQFRAEPVGVVHFGTVCSRADDPAALIAGWRDAMRTADEALTSTLALLPATAGRPAVATVLACYAGADAAAATRALAPLRALGAITGDMVRPRRYAGILDDAEPAAGRRRSTFVPELDDRLVDALAAGRTALALHSLGGAIARVPAGATAFAHRDAEALLIEPEPPAAPGPPAATVGQVAAVYPPDTRRRLAAVKRAYDPDNVFRRSHAVAPA